MALPRLKLQLSKRRLSSQQRLDLLAGAITLVLLALQTTLWQPGWLVSTAIIAAGVLLAVLQRLALAPLQREINALNLHAQNLQDGSFNTSANQLMVRELSALANSLNLMSAQLRSERATLYQRELLLDTVLQSSPSAMLLTDANNTILMSNPAARQLLSHGKAFDGAKLNAVLNTQPQLAQAISGQQQGLLNEVLTTMLSGKQKRTFSAEGSLQIDTNAAMQLDLVAMQLKFVPRA